MPLSLVDLSSIQFQANTTDGVSARYLLFLSGN